MSTNQVVLDVVLLKGAEKTTTPQACVLKLLPEGQGAQPGLGEGLAHRPWAPLPVPRRLRRSPELIRGEAAAAHVAEALDALIDQGGRGLPVRHRHAAAEQHLELLGESVIELGRAAELVLAGDLPGLPDGADDLRHLRARKECYLEPAVAGTAQDPHPQKPTPCSPHRHTAYSISLKEHPTGNLGPGEGNGQLTQRQEGEKYLLSTSSTLGLR